MPLDTASVIDTGGWHNTWDVEARQDGVLHLSLVLPPDALAHAACGAGRIAPLAILTLVVGGLAGALPDTLGPVGHRLPYLGVGETKPGAAE